MYALVANGIQTVCKTLRELNALTAIYPYPKFQQCKDEAEGREWIRHHQRTRKTRAIVNYGDTVCEGYIDASYTILEGRVECTLDTSKIGNIRIRPNADMAVENRRKSIRIVFLDTELNDDLIHHHVVVVRRLLNIVGEYMDINIHLPDISVYLALTAYTGTNYLITGAKKAIAQRLGAVAFTVD